MCGAGSENFSSQFLIPADVQPHSIAHGANDISNAIGPFTTEYETWSTGVVSAKTDTPYWIKAVGGLGLSVGFWIFGYRKSCPILLVVQC